MIPLSISSAVSTTVGDHLGAGRPADAQVSASTSLVLTAGIATVLTGVTLAVRRRWAQIFTSDAEVRDLVSLVMPLLSVSQWFDSMQCVLSGVLRGTGLQARGALINLIAQWGVGLPAALTFAFVLEWGFIGLWAGIGLGTIVQFLLEGVLVCRIDWSRVSDEAVLRSKSAAQPHLALHSKIGDESEDVLECNDMCDAHVHEVELTTNEGTDLAQIVTKEDHEDHDRHEIMLDRLQEDHCEPP